MINPSSFLSRALLADAAFSGVSAVGLTLGAGVLAPFLSLPEALLGETGLFLIAYTALVGWLGTRQSVPRAPVLLVVAGNAAWTLASIALLFSGAVNPNLSRRDCRGGAGNRNRRIRRAAIHRPAQERRRGCGLNFH